jgi:hypothetical protein
LNLRCVSWVTVRGMLWQNARGRWSCRRGTWRGWSS